MAYPEWLQELIDAIPASYEEMIEHKPMAKNETVVGIIEKLDQRKLAVICVQISGAMIELSEKHQAMHDSEQAHPLTCLKHHILINELRLRLGDISQMFWRDIRNELGLDQVYLGFRENWQIVTWEEDEPAGYELGPSIMETPFGPMSMN